jgi:hypothetical protein
MKLSEWQRLLREAKPEAPPEPKKGGGSVIERFGFAVDSSLLQGRGAPRRWIERKFRLNEWVTERAAKEIKRLLQDELGWPAGAQLMYNEDQDILADSRSYLFYIECKGDVSQILPASWEISGGSAPTLVLPFPEPAASAIAKLVHEKMPTTGEMIDALLHDAKAFGAWPDDTKAIEVTAFTADEQLHGSLESQFYGAHKRPFLVGRDKSVGHLNFKWDHFPGARLTLSRFAMEAAFGR